MSFGFPVLPNFVHLPLAIPSLSWAALSVVIVVQLLYAGSFSCYIYFVVLVSWACPLNILLHARLFPAAFLFLGLVPWTFGVLPRCCMFGVYQLLCCFLGLSLENLGFHPVVPGLVLPAALLFKHAWRSPCCFIWPGKQTAASTFVVWHGLLLPNCLFLHVCVVLCVLRLVPLVAWGGGGQLAVSATIFSTLVYDAAQTLFATKASLTESFGSTSIETGQTSEGHCSRICTSSNPSSGAPTDECPCGDWAPSRPPRRACPPGSGRGHSTPGSTEFSGSGSGSSPACDPNPFYLWPFGSSLWEFALWSRSCWCFLREAAHQGELPAVQAETRPAQLFASCSAPLDTRVPDRIRAKIWANFCLTLFWTTSSSYQFIAQTAERSHRCVEPLSRPKRIQSNEAWLSAFHVFVGVYTSKYPHEAPSLMKYGEIVQDLAARGSN